MGVDRFAIGVIAKPVLSVTLSPRSQRQAVLLRVRKWPKTRFDFIEIELRHRGGAGGKLRAPGSGHRRQRLGADAAVMHRFRKEPELVLSPCGGERVLYLIDATAG